MRRIFILFILLFTFSCEKPEPNHPQKLTQDRIECHEQDPDCPILAPPPAYGNKVVMK